MATTLTPVHGYITNHPRYSIPCWFYHSPHGCRFGKNCWYQHIILNPKPYTQHQQQPDNNMNIKMITEMMAYIIQLIIFIKDIMDIDTSLPSPPTSIANMMKNEYHDDDIKILSTSSTTINTPNTQKITTNKTNNKQCRYFNAGWCKYGTSCRYVHDDENIDPTNQTKECKDDEYDDDYTDNDDDDNEHAATPPQIYLQKLLDETIASSTTTNQTKPNTKPITNPTTNRQQTKKKLTKPNKPAKPSKQRKKKKKKKKKQKKKKKNKMEQAFAAAIAVSDDAASAANPIAALTPTLRETYSSSNDDALNDDNTDYITMNRMKQTPIIQRLNDDDTDDSNTPSPYERFSREKNVELIPENEKQKVFIDWILELQHFELSNMAQSKITKIKQDIYKMLKYEKINEGYKYVQKIYDYYIINDINQSYHN